MSVSKTPSRRNQKAKTQSWFRTENKYVRSGALVVSLVSISPASTQRRRKLIISVPKACGTAVQRNRFRRVLRAHLRNVVNCELPENKGLWIRLLNTHRLGKVIRWTDWKKVLSEAMMRLQILKDSAEL